MVKVKKKISGFFLKKGIIKNPSLREGRVKKIFQCYTSSVCLMRM